MSRTCDFCKVVLIFKEPNKAKANDIFGYPCDHCQTCGNITGPTETRAIVLSNRAFPFYCKECLSNVKQILGLADRVGILKRTLKNMETNLPTIIRESVASAIAPFKDRISRMESHDLYKEVEDRISRLESCNPATDTSYPASKMDVLAELHDRQSRAGNLLIFNLLETEDDMNQAHSLLKMLIGTHFTLCRVSRFGKPNSKNARPLRASLESAYEVHTALRNGHKLKNKQIYIKSDLTPAQRDLEKLAMEDLKKRRDQGEQNIQLKVIEGIPQIVSKKTPQWVKHAPQNQMEISTFKIKYLSKYPWTKNQVGHTPM